MKYIAIIILLFISIPAQASDWYLGNWEVIDAKIPGTSAMDMEEAMVWFGSVATYTKEKVSFRNETCTVPAFKIQSLSEDEFYSSYRTTFADLGIKGNALEILQVGCPSDWIAPGSTLIKANDNFSYTLWNGVFFKIAKNTP